MIIRKVSKKKSNAKKYNFYMSEIRIKELASAAGQLDKFEAFEFIVDVPATEGTMKIKGSELQERFAPTVYTHPIVHV